MEPCVNQPLKHYQIHNQNILRFLCEPVSFCTDEAPSQRLWIAVLWETQGTGMNQEVRWLRKTVAWYLSSCNISVLCCILFNYWIWICWVLRSVECFFSPVRVLIWKQLESVHFCQDPVGSVMQLIRIIPKMWSFILCDSLNKGHQGGFSFFISFFSGPCCNLACTCVISDQTTAIPLYVDHNGMLWTGKERI